MTKVGRGALAVVVASALACGGVGGGSGAPPALALAREGGGTVGPAGVTLVAAFAGPVDGAPATVQVRAGDTIVATLQRAGAEPRYAGSWVPGAGMDGDAALVALASAGGRSVESAALVVPVDTKPPVVTGLVVRCSVEHADGRCRRHEALDVTVQAPDAETVTATLDLDGHSVAAPLAGTTARSGTVQLGAYPFPRYEGPVVLRVHAADALGNVSQSAQAAIEVTRLRWEYDTGAAGVTESAIDLAQRVAFGVTGAASGALRILRPGCDPSAAQAEPPCVTEVSLGVDVALAAAPMVGFGFQRIWFPTTDGRLLARGFDGSPANGAGCSVAATGPVAMSPRNADVVVANGDAMYTADGTNCNQSGIVDTRFLRTPVTATQGKVYAVSAGVDNGVSLRAFRFFNVGGLDLVETWPGQPVDLGPASSAPLAIDRQNRVLVLSSDGTLRRVTDAGATGTASVVTSALPPGATVSPIVLRDDSIVVAGGATLVRLADGGATLWQRTLPAAVTGALATVPDASGVALYVTTADGALRALRLDGADAWDAPAQLSAAALASPNVGAQESTRFLYVGAADGRLRAIVVDEDLDLDAPWPKPYRDEQNSSRAR